MRLTKPLLAWSLYDWASSPVPTLHATFIFSVFFTTAVMPEGGSVAWAWMTAATAFLLAIAAPVFGRMADQRGNAKSFLGLMVLLGGAQQRAVVRRPTVLCHDGAAVICPVHLCNGNQLCVL